MHSICGRLFPSKAKCKLYVSGLLQANGPGRVRAGSELHNALSEIIQNHARAREKIGCGIVSFQVRETYSRNGLETSVVRSDGTTETFSWVQCSMGVSGTARSRLLSALRVAVEGDAQAFRECATAGCARCGLVGARLEVDHRDLTFSEIASRFLSVAGWRIPTAFSKDPVSNRDVFLAADSAFSSEWRTFHRACATYQLLCRSCHERKSRMVSERRRSDGGAGGG